MHDGRRYKVIYASLCPIYIATQDIVKIEVSSLNNPIPTDDGACHYIDKTEIEASTVIACALIIICHF